VAAAPGGPAEIVENGETGLLYPMGDRDALAQALRRLAGDPELRARLGDAGRRAAARYAPEHVAAEVRALYAAVLGRRGR
ncbi:MAG TPA: glycosyltransferase, partial [Acidimicrobiia bacterium]|nr:glycosyltransferase [Acidimicrobiia bacterium]